jgi:hypothetical protein
MKALSFFFVTSAALAFQLSLLSGQAAPTPKTATETASTNTVPKSVFTIPASKKDGCDPFFPTSMRLWGGSAPVQSTTTKARATGLDCLVLKGLSGTEGNRLAMINGRTMARGEDAEINTDCGRLLVHCVDITSNSAVIEVSGDRRELKLRSDL